jgi:hypothetical protein
MTYDFDVFLNVNFFGWSLGHCNSQDKESKTQFLSDKQI